MFFTFNRNCGCGIIIGAILVLLIISWVLRAITWLFFLFAPVLIIATIVWYVINWNAAKKRQNEQPKDTYNVDAEVSDDE